MTLLFIFFWIALGVCIGYVFGAVMATRHHLDEITELRAQLRKARRG